MDKLSCIVYISRATKHISKPGLERLLNDARQFNHEHDVTGVLLHHHDVFFQYIEGRYTANNGLHRVYDRIKNSSQHRDIDELFIGSISERVFPLWSMGSTFISEQSFLSLKNAHWKTNVSEMIARDSLRKCQGFNILKAVIDGAEWIDSQ